MEWQLIKTAPKDGTRVLLFYAGLNRPHQIGHFFETETFEHGKSVSKRQGWSAGMMSFLGNDVEPTHWMPLPQPPSV